MSRSGNPGILGIFGAVALSGCAAGLNFPSSGSQTSSTPNPVTAQTQLAAAAIGARVDFITSNFFTLTSSNSEFQCAGDLKTYYDPLALVLGLPPAFPPNFLDPTVSIQPAFIKNISVDLTNSNDTVDYPRNLAFNCSYGANQSVPSANCAIFDSTENSQITAVGYRPALAPSGTGYYTTFDSGCLGAGPIVSSDPSTNKESVGGIFFDIDRTQLGSQENLLLHLTLLPIGPQNLVPDLGNDSSSLIQSSIAQAAVLKVHLTRTGQSASTLQGVYQPRSLTYSDATTYPLLDNSMVTIPPPYGQVREEQVLIPLSLDPSIDRIWVQRFTGTVIFISAKLIRLGAH